MIQNGDERSHEEGGRGHEIDEGQKVLEQGKEEARGEGHENRAYRTHGPWLFFPALK